MKQKIVHILITKNDGTYTAEGMNANVVTQGATLDELEKNIKEVVGLYFEGEDPETLGFVKSPAVVASLELAS